MATPARAAQTLPVSVHGSAGVLDLVVPAGATSVDVAREYAAQAGLAAIPLLQTALGDLLPAGRPLVGAGVLPGDVLVAATGVHRPRAATLRDLVRAAPESPGLAAVVATAAGGAAALAAAYGVRAGDDARTATVAVLLTAALVAVLPVGRHAAQRAVAAPAFGAAAAFTAVHEPGAHLLPAVVAVSALAAAAVAALARTARAARDEALTVWIVTGAVVAGTCSLAPLLEWDPRVVWTLLLVLAVLAGRAVPSLAVDVPDEALLDLDRLAVTAWSARERATGSRGRVVVAGEAMARLVAGATRTVTAAAAAVLGVTVVATPLLLASAEVDLDRLGARSLVLFAGASLLLAARSYRHAAARAFLRLAGLGAWLWLAGHLVATDAAGSPALVVGLALALGLAALAAAVATGRGWRSAWWARRAEVAESLAGALALASVVVSTGLFRLLWETTS